MPKAAVVEIKEGGWNEDQFKHMDSELKVLQKNHDELEGLVAQLQKKAAASRAVPNERVEQAKLESNIKELKREGMGLKADLEAVRVQMVELDKRKTRLETMLR